MTISWFPNKPAHIARLINHDNEDDVRSWIYGDLMRQFTCKRNHISRPCIDVHFNRTKSQTPDKQTPSSLEFVYF
jgi:hypothetical protein